MSSKRNFEEQVAALDAVRQLGEQDRVAALRKALTHRNNFIAAKAADLVREFNMVQLMPELLSAFDRFFENPVKTDPQCWAKNALSRSLAALEYQEPKVFLRGMRHIQMEPVWGGRSDTAGTLRATSALALVQCRAVREPELLAHLLELLTDADKAVRVEAVHAIEQVGSPSAGLLLRLRAVLGTDEPEVLGACYGGILRLEGVGAVAWARRFLRTGDDNAAEAALAIAGTHSVEAFEALRESFAKADDPWWRSALLSAISLTRQDAALEFLMDLVATESLHAEAATEAIIRSMPSHEIIARLKKLVAGNPRLARVFAEQQERTS
jgi:HEAT repeat protein